jgi:hypothetical protein
MLALACCYLMWMVTYMAQLHPLIGEWTARRPLFWLTTDGNSAHAFSQALVDTRCEYHVSLSFLVSNWFLSAL